MYNLQIKHKVLTPKVIGYLRKCFAYVLTSHRDDTDGIRKGLLNRTNHAFGCHEECEETWCGYQKSPNTYKHVNLPYGLDLSGEELRADLQKLFRVYAENAKKLPPLGSTQVNENFNCVVAAKAPKNRHYSSSESLCFRVGSAVCMKHVGQMYLPEVYQKAGLTQTAATTRFAMRESKKALKSKRMTGTRECKLRRNELREKRTSTNNALEIREGVSYQSSIALQAADQDSEEIPEPICYPAAEKVPTDNYCHISFDVETTSLGDDNEIVQLSAVTENSSYNRYVVPETPILSHASKITGLTVVGNSFMLKGAPVPTVSIYDCLSDFILWAQTFEKPVLSYGHNVKFDAKALVRACRKVDMVEKLKTAVVGFSALYRSSKLFSLIILVIFKNE